MLQLQTVRKIKARDCFWDSLFPDWRDFKQNDFEDRIFKAS